MVTRQKVLASVATAILTLGAGAGYADDTDIYVDIEPPTPGSEPMVMFSLDYRPNLGSTACQGDECDSLIAEGYLP